MSRKRGASTSLSASHGSSLPRPLMLCRGMGGAQRSIYGSYTGAQRGHSTPVCVHRSCARYTHLLAWRALRFPQLRELPCEASNPIASSGNGAVRTLVDPSPAVLLASCWRFCDNDKGHMRETLASTSVVVGGLGLQPSSPWSHETCGRSPRRAPVLTA